MTTHHSLYSQIPRPTDFFASPAFTLPLSASAIPRRWRCYVCFRMKPEAISGRKRLARLVCSVGQEVEHRLGEKAQSALRPVVNLTGTVLHQPGTRPAGGRGGGCGRAGHALAGDAGYDLDGAGRGHRDRALADLLCQLTGAEDACIVNNNAAAVLLMLAATASGREWWCPAASWWRLAGRFASGRDAPGGLHAA